MYRDMVVMGGSAGSIPALTEITRSLPAGCPSVLFVVVHIPPNRQSHLAEILGSGGPLRALQVTESLTIQPGTIYVAPPDAHMLIERNHVFPWRGPREDRHRPAINPLFRSAAETFGPNVAGVILSGALQDGSAGLWKVKQRGGVAIVQDPHTAPFGDMPENVLKYVQADHVLPSQEIGPLLSKLSCDTPEDRFSGSMMKSVSAETKVVLEARCPDCHGPLSEVRDGDIHEFRCLVGHSYSPENILQAQSETEENALWSAVAAIEESVILIRRLLPQLPEEGAARLEREIEKRLGLAREARNIIERLGAVRVN